MTDAQLESANRELELLQPKEILAWVLARWKTQEIVATSSFQNQSVPFLHMVSELASDLKILFLDTGFHFKETLEFRDRLTQLLGLFVVNLRPEIFPPEKLYRTDTDACCALNKVQPLDKALRGARVWLAGIRRDQTEHRSFTSVVTRHPSGVLKICPFVNWDQFDVDVYLYEHPHLPQHPLATRGYQSIGCLPCTQKSEGRDGRWYGQIKTECGLHGR